MSFVARRGLSTLVPPKIASPSSIGAARDAARMQRIGSFYGKLPRGPAPQYQPKGLIERYMVRYAWGENGGKMPIIHLIAFLLVLGYAQHHYFHFRHQKNNAH